MKVQQYYHRLKSIVTLKEVTVYLSRSTLYDLKHNIGSCPNEVGHIRQLTKFADIEYILYARAVTDQRTRSKLTKLYMRRLQRGDKCFLCLDNDICIGYLWIALGSVYIESVDYEMTLSNDTIAIYDVFTKARYRGRGVYRYLLAMIANHFKEYNYAILWVMKHNISAINAQSKCGFNNIYAEIKMISCCRMIRHRIKEVEYLMESLLSDE